MLKQLSVENFTVFSEASFEFAPGLNVIVGENGTGKSHVLKLAYAILAENQNQIRAQNSKSNEFRFSGHYAEKLQNVFRTERVHYLKRKVTVANKVKQQIGSLSKVCLDFGSLAFEIAFTGPYQPLGAFNIKQSPEKMVMATKAVFIPTRELLSIYPGFVSLYEGRYLEFEETYRDTCLLLGEPLLKKPMADLMSVLEEAMGGKIELDNGRFYLVTPEQGKLEMPLVAEGLRKLAMLAQLIAVGALEKDGYLFWDEPEVNLNPRLIKVVAKVIQQLTQAGIQVFIATHSLFLLRELEILQSTASKPVSQRYFALKQGADGVEVEQGDSADDLQTLVMLEEELRQSDRYMDVA